jgi:hypothetical protein
MTPDDPAYFMLTTGPVSIPVVYNDKCYICRDPEYAQMGLPLCQKCLACGGHVAADDDSCDDCGESAYELWLESQVDQR